MASSAFTGWRFLVNFLLPPPMILTFLLVLPFPREVRKAILIVTNKVLSLTVLGGLKFVHLALVLSGVPLIDSGFRTYKINIETQVELTPNQRLSVLAKKWREERNFWIAAMAFTLWCLLTVLYSQVNQAMKIHDQLDQVTEELNELKGIKPAPAGPTARARVAEAGSKLQANVTSTIAGLAGGWGKGPKAKDEGPSNETELASGTGDDTPGVTTRRRAAAGVSS